jgi:hypothetical protein
LHKRAIYSHPLAWVVSETVVKEKKVARVLPNSAVRFVRSGWR